MENTVVAFEKEDGTIGLLYPALNSGLTLAQIIQKDLDSGVRYKIINRSDVPADRSYRNAWQIDFTDAEVNE